MVANTRKELITDQFIRSLCSRLSENKRVRRKLPIWGRVHIDRQLPFLCVYRRPPERNDTGTERLLFGEAAYLMASGEDNLHSSLCSLVRNIAETQARVFDHVLIIEIWSSHEEKDARRGSISLDNPAFRIHAPSGEGRRTAVESLAGFLKSVRLQKKLATVEIESVELASPDGYKPLLRRRDLRQIGVTLIGLEVRPIYRHPETGVVYPLVLRSLHRSLARSFKRTFFEFSRLHTRHRAPHFLAMGRRAMVKAVWDVDVKLADVSNSFSLLLTVTPTNADSAFSAFKRSGYKKVPKFTYRPISVDTALLKRSLHNISVERVEDPVLAQIFREQQDDLDRRLTLLSDLGTTRFLYGSMQIFGGVKNWIFEIAIELLSTLSPRSRDESKGGYVTAEKFAKYAADEIDYYRRTYDGFSASCQVREDVSGLIVSKGTLLIGKRSKIPRLRIKALLQHEIGTHLLTYFNGKTQPLKQFYVGLAGYDELQEGLAILSEYLVDGLTRTRMRLLAARVVAVRRLIEGATFMETFRELNSVYGFEKRTAFMITVRVFRGGGLTKDATYLKGLLRLMQYLGDGGDFVTLLMGKFNTDHIPFIKELKYRSILHPAPLLPRYLSESHARDKLVKLEKSLNLSDLFEPEKARRASK